MRDPSYGLLRSSLELMLILNTSDTMQYGFMLSRVYLQLNINHDDVMSMLQEYRDIPGIGDQVDYLMNACQIQMDERRLAEPEPEVKDRGGVSVSFPYGEVELRVGQVCRHRKYDYVCVVYGWDGHCKASKVNWPGQTVISGLRTFILCRAGYLRWEWTSCRARTNNPSIMSWYLMDQTDTRPRRTSVQ